MRRDLGAIVDCRAADPCRRHRRLAPLECIRRRIGSGRSLDVQRASRDLAVFVSASCVWCARAAHSDLVRRRSFRRARSPRPAASMPVRCDRLLLVPSHRRIQAVRRRALACLQVGRDVLLDGVCSGSAQLDRHRRCASASSVPVSAPPWAFGTARSIPSAAWIQRDVAAIAFSASSCARISRSCTVDAARSIRACALDLDRAPLDHRSRRSASSIASIVDARIACGRRSRAVCRPIGLLQLAVVSLSVACVEQLGHPV